jgi:hypothetical protein
VHTNSFILHAQRTQNSYDNFAIPLEFIPYCNGYKYYQLSKDKKYIRLTDDNGREFICYLVPDKMPDWQQVRPKDSDYYTYSEDLTEKTKVNKIK